MNLNYSVIYTVDMCQDQSVQDWKPSGKQWKQTEGDEEYQFNHLGGLWKHGKHRKWIAYLTAKQFERFVKKFDLKAEDVETMGSLGASGFGIGWAPAISFSTYDYSCLVNAYVTPVPVDQSIELSDETWKEIRQYILHTFG